MFFFTFSSYCFIKNCLYVVMGDFTCLILIGSKIILLRYDTIRYDTKKPNLGGKSGSNLKIPVFRHQLQMSVLHIICHEN